MDSYFSLVFWWIIIIALVLFAWWALTETSRKGPLKSPKPRLRRYVRGEFDEQMEFDLRLTYKRFKELYPYTDITYEEYKKLQMERAFRRAIGSEKNRRRVR